MTAYLDGVRVSISCPGMNPPPLPGRTRAHVSIDFHEELPRVSVTREGDRSLVAEGYVISHHMQNRCWMVVHCMLSACPGEDDQSRTPHFGAMVSIWMYDKEDLK